MTHTLNPHQISAVKHIDGPLLVIAGAGSGKTRVVTNRIAYLIQEGIAPNKICAVTFTNKAAGEMQERIGQLLVEQNVSSHPTICTFHSLGARIMRESIQHLGYKADFVIYDEDDTSKLLRGCMQSLDISKESAQFKLFRKLISHSKNQLQEVGDMDLSDESSQVQASFPACYKLYQERLLQANALDFDDLLYLTVRLFREHPEVLEQYQQKWPYLLIDEYQDTNRAQYLIAQLLVQKSNNLFVVGDPDQSIYSWRGANVRNILNFERDFPGAKIVRLEQNYRSRKNILDAANALIKHNKNRLEKNLYSDRGDGEKISYYIAEDEHDEADFVVGEIDRLRNEEMIPLSEICIFYRTNFQSRRFEDYLLRMRIPYQIIGGISFYQRREVKDILAFLRLIVSDQDIVSFERTINIPKRGIGDTTINKICQLCEQIDTPTLATCRALVAGEQTMRLREKQKIALKEFLDLIDELREVHKQGCLQTTVIETIKRTNYFDYLRQDKETFEDRRANVEELITKAHEFEGFYEDPTLTLFLEELSLKGNLDESDLEAEKLNLMTVHNSKGLEFDAAFLVGMEEDLFPHANSRSSYEAVEEERRLCYVGMTRAKERLYFTVSKTRFMWGSYRVMRLSRFLKEIPRNYLKTIS